MLKSTKKVVTLMLITCILISGLSACGKTKGVSKEDEPTGSNKPVKVVRLGHHKIKEIDINYKDPVTGESTIKPNVRAGLVRAVDACKEQLNVEIKYVQYKKNATEDIIKSVLANDPLCDLPFMAFGTGTIIGQNVLQSLDGYSELFKDPEYQWMYPNKIYGHHFLLNPGVEFTQTECLVYNIGYLNKVDSLKENGKTVLPTDLWKQGKWTWSVYEDYLKKISAYYENKTSPVKTDVPISAYKTDVTRAVMSAITSNGGCLVGEQGMDLDSKEILDAVKYIENLADKKLIVQSSWHTGLTRENEFKGGETVFSNLGAWGQTVVGPVLAQRGEAMGIIPFPRPDDMEEDDPRYQQLVEPSGQVGVVRGLSKEQTELALKTFKVYYYESFKGINNTESSPVDYFKNKENAKDQALLHGFDVTSEAYGDDIVDAYMAYNPNLQANDYVKLMSWTFDWQSLVRKSILGLDGAPPYETGIGQAKSGYQDMDNKIISAVSSESIVDNILPKIALTNGSLAFPKGTDGSKIEWNKYIAATDNIDGNIPIDQVKIDASKVKFDTVGLYSKGLYASVKDKEGNEAKANMDVRIFDKDNKVPPTIEIKKEYRAIKKDEDSSKINWGRDFVQKATTAEGFDIKGSVKADVSSLDVTTEGKYTVTLTATDYAGNSTDVKIEVVVGGK